MIAQWTHELWDGDEGVEARRLLAGRGIDRVTADLFELGYCPATYEDEHLADRLVLPVRDLQGTLLGYLGRALSDSPHAAKFTTVGGFARGDVLFVHPDMSARRPRTIILTEGCFDVLALAAAGCERVCATMGPLTREQGAILAEACGQVLIAADGDIAGRRGAVRAQALLNAAGCQAVIHALPTGTDPADLVSEPALRVHLDALLTHAGE